MILTAEQMEAALAKMSAEMREHLRFVIGALIECYTDDNAHGVLLVGSDNGEQLKLMAINATEMDVAELMTRANEHINFIAMQDAPPKEKFN